MKIDAGWKFQRRNPSSAPASAKHRTATNGWPTATVSEITPSVTAAISPTPDERPSRPSIQLMLLIMPRIQNTLKATADVRTERDVAEVEHPASERVRDEVDADADRDGGERQKQLAEALPARPELEVVVRGADDGRQRRRRRAAPASPARRSNPASAIRPATVQERHDDRHGHERRRRSRGLPRAAPGATLTRRRSGRSTTS